MDRIALGMDRPPVDMDRSYTDSGSDRVAYRLDTDWTATDSHWTWIRRTGHADKVRENECGCHCRGKVCHTELCVVFKVVRAGVVEILWLVC